MTDHESEVLVFDVFSTVVDLRGALLAWPITAADLDEFADRLGA